MSEYSDAAFAMFGLQQPLTLAEIAEIAPELRFRMAGSQIPHWFAAAADGDSTLPEIAPELQALLAGKDVTGALDGVDLVRLFAPELQVLTGPNGGAGAEKIPAGESAQVSEQPTGAVQIGLLLELSDLDD
ncbi:MAG: hypothetical protein Q7L55_05735 [Actinomycetota bacterium]|nr:hypothetical protein [Actinomycetota bacterium]